MIVVNAVARRVSHRPLIPDTRHCPIAYTDLSTFENTQWKMLNKCNKLRPHLKTNTRNSSQTQDIALLHTLTCSLSTFEDKHSGKSQTNATSVTLRTQDIALLCTLTCSMCTFEDTHSGKKPNKCTQWKKPNNTFETNTRGRFRLYTLTPV